MLSLIRTVIENGLDPYRYLTWLHKTANNADLTDEQMVRIVLPWNATVECRVKRITMPIPKLFGVGNFIHTSSDLTLTYSHFF